jgi:hypothetical protein
LIISNHEEKKAEKMETDWPPPAANDDENDDRDVDSVIAEQRSIFVMTY